MKNDSSLDSSPLAHTLEQFDSGTGSVIERAVFNHRGWIVVVCALLTLLFAWQATKLQLNASFEKTIPTHHPYIQNFLRYQSDLQGSGNAVRIAVANPNGGIYDAHYLEVLRKLNDAVFLLPGVERTRMKSLWTPNMRWVGVTEDGLEGGTVIPDAWNSLLPTLHAPVKLGKSLPRTRSPA
jgi:uncharacterized protein